MLDAIDHSARAALTPVEVFSGRILDVCGLFNVAPPPGAMSCPAMFRSTSLAGWTSRISGRTHRMCTEHAKTRDETPETTFFLLLQREGSGFLEQADRSYWTSPCDMFLVDSANECRFNFQGKYALQMSIHLPRDEMIRRFGRRIRRGLAIEGLTRWPLR